MKRFALIALALFACTLASAQTVPQRAIVAANNAFAASNSRPPQPIHLASLRSAETPDGSRIIVTSDVTLHDYQAYTESSRFYLLIPYSIEPKSQNELRGRGFTDALVERRGDDVLLFFGLEAGARAHVQQRLHSPEIYLFIVIITPLLT